LDAKFGVTNAAACEAALDRVFVRLSISRTPTGAPPAEKQNAHPVEEDHYA
jgi:hypothetical protein